MSDARLLSVLMVEDEELIRERIHGAVDWEELGYSEPVWAADGDTALDMASALRPDVMLLDINIPRMNGLELARRVRDLHLDTRIIVITGYDRFDYAQEAIRLGVSNYLLKPLDEDEFAAELRQVRDELTGIAPDRPDGTVAVESHGGWTKPPDSLADRAEVLGRYRVLIVEVEPDPARVKESLDGHVDLSLVSEYLASVFTESEILVESDRRRLLIVVNEERQSPESVPVSTRVRSALDTVRQLTRVRPTAVLSEPASYEPELRPGFMRTVDEALAAADAAFFAPRGALIRAGELDHTVRNDSLLSLEYYRGVLLSRLRAGQDCSDTILKVFETVLQTRVSRDFTYLTALELVNVGLTILNEFGLRFGVVFPDVRSVAALVHSQTSVQGLAEVCNETYRRIAVSIGENQSSPTTRLVNKARNYIDLHFTDPHLSLDRIVERTGGNASYLSSVFKQIVSMSVTEYITSRRLHSAKRRMGRDPTIRIQDLAEACGYHDPFYFSKAFKKAYGISPREYRARLHGHDMRSNSQ